MKQKHLSVMFAAIGLAVSGLSYAGVVPQYRFQNGGKGYEPLVDAVVLKKPGSTVVSSCYIFPKNEVVNAYKARASPSDSISAMQVRLSTSSRSHPTERFCWEKMRCSSRVIPA